MRMRWGRMLPLTSLVMRLPRALLHHGNTPSRHPHSLPLPQTPSRLLDLSSNYLGATKYEVSTTPT